MREIEALQVIQAAARLSPGAPENARLQYALKWLDQRLAEAVDSGRFAVRIGMAARVKD